MISKDERQKIAIEKWRQNFGRGTLNHIMRFGKTIEAQKIITNFRNKHPFDFILVLVPNEITKKNANKYLAIDERVQILTASQYINYVKENFNYISPTLLIIDEIHDMMSEKIWECIINTKSRFILCLTGSTLTKKQISKLEEINCPIIDTITEIEAINNKWISNFIEYNVPVQLGDIEKEEYVKYSKLISESLQLFKGIYPFVNERLGVKVFKNEFELLMSCYIAKKYIDNKTGIQTMITPDIIRNIVANCQGWTRDLDITNKSNQRISRLWNPDNIKERAKTFRDFINQRNKILIHNRAKLDAVVEILKANPVPTICFNESTEMVDDIANQFPIDSIAYHSNISSRYMIDPETNQYYTTVKGEKKKIGKTTLKNMAIGGMETGKYKYLITAKALNVGLTIPNIEQVITTGGSTDPQTHGQRVARGKTFDYLNPNKICIIINLYVDDFEIEVDGEVRPVLSRDKQKLELRQEENETSPIWVQNISEIFS